VLEVGQKTQPQNSCLSQIRCVNISYMEVMCTIFTTESTSVADMHTSGSNVSDSLPHTNNYFCICFVNTLQHKCCWSIGHLACSKMLYRVHLKSRRKYIIGCTPVLTYIIFTYIVCFHEAIMSYRTCYFIEHP